MCWWETSTREGKTGDSGEGTTSAMNGDINHMHNWKGDSG